MLVEIRKSTSSTNCLEKVLYELRLLHSKQLSGSSKTDFYNTKINLDPSRNALTTLNTKVTHYIFADDVYAMSVHEGNKEKWTSQQKLSLTTSHQ